MNYRPVILVLALTGCSSLTSHFKTPSVAARTPSMSVSQAGTVAAPAQAAVTTTTTSMPVPAGAKVTVEMPSTLPAATPTPALETKTVSESVVAPTSFAPPAPPTAKEQAVAAGLRWFYIGGVLCGLAALFALYQGHPINAAVLGGGAVGLPIVGNIVSSDWAIYIVIGIAALSLGLTIAWFNLRKHHPEYIAALKQKISQ